MYMYMLYYGYMYIHVRHAHTSVHRYFTPVPAGHCEGYDGKLVVSLGSARELTTAEHGQRRTVAP